jgi:hypothetical protein
MRPEAGAPSAEGLFQRAIQDKYSHCKKRLKSEPVATPLLLLDHSFCDYLIDCGFDPSCGVRLVSSVALAKMARRSESDGV